MAVPTVTSVEPSAGSTRGGDVIRVHGTNFRLPDPVPATGPIQSDQQKTLSVQFEGVESEWAYAASSTLLLAKVPTWAGAYDISFPLQLDVRVANLDNAGVEIPGENATLADAYSIDRPSLAAETYLQRAIREVIRLFRRHVLENTHHTTSRDFSLTPALQETVRAEGPLVQLHGPRMPINRFDSINVEGYESDPLGGPSGMMRRRRPVTVNLEFGVSIWAKGDRQLNGLIQAVLLFHRDIKYLKVPVDPGDPSKGTRDYEFEMPWPGFPEADTAPNSSDLLTATTQSHVRGVHIDEDFGTIIERGWVITQNDGVPVLQIQSV